MILRKTFRFEASHILPKHPGKCSRLHGHSWVLHVFVEGPVDVHTGFVMDFADISKTINPIIDALDHRHLGAYPGDIRGLDIYRPTIPEFPTSFYPTSEVLLSWLGVHLLGRNFQWSALAIEETCTSGAYLARRDHDSSKGGIFAQLDKK